MELKELLKTKGLNLSELATRIGIAKSNTTRWSKKRVPAERVLIVEKETGIPRHVLRPDIYPPSGMDNSDETAA